MQFRCWYRARPVTFQLKIVRGEEKKGLVDVVLRQTGWEEWQRSFVPARKRFPVILQQNPKRQRHYLKAMRKSGENLFAQEPGQEVSISYMTGEIKKDGIRHNTEAFSENPDKPEEKILRIWKSRQRHFMEWQKVS